MKNEQFGTKKENFFNIFYFSFFTFHLPGLAVFLIALVMLLRGLAAKNAYEILLSSAALVFWVLLFFAGSWAKRHLTALEALLHIPLPLTAASEEDWLVTCNAVRLPLFFRLHFIVRGRFFPQGSSRGCAVIAETSFPRGGDRASLNLSFPLGGLFQGETLSRLRDIFGFFSFPCGLSSNQILKVRSAPCPSKPLRVEALSGAEDRRTKSSTDEERYYMREYAPGDRLRDINWKSSERIDTLITRISPDNQEKVTRIEVYFRNYGPSRPGIGELWLLDRAKARLAWFLRTVKEENASFIFDVRTALESWDLSKEDEIDMFLEELASITFCPAQSGELSTDPLGDGELFVFSTACDFTLPSFLLGRQGKPVSLFMIQNPLGGKTDDRKIAGRKADFAAEECAHLHLRDFPAKGFIPFPGWFLPQQKKLLNARSGRMMIDYAETGI